MPLQRQMSWTLFGATGTFLAALLLLWLRHGREPAWAEPEAARPRVLAKLDQALAEGNRCRTNDLSGAGFQRWLKELRTEFRPFFNLLSSRFDSQLIFVTRELDSHMEDKGPLAEHSRQLVWVSVRSLLLEEASRLRLEPGERAEYEKQLISLPASALMDAR